MKKIVLYEYFLLILIVIIISGCSSSDQVVEITATPTVTSENVQQYASDAVIFGFPAVMMDVTRKVMTNVSNPLTTGWNAPINQLSHARQLSDYTNTDTLSPNNDTLYNTGWIDTNEGPWILSVPDTNGRYYVMQTLNYWTDVFGAPGPRTTGTGAGQFAITGPDWSGTLPSGVQEMKSTTRYVWLVGRILCKGESDYDNVHQIEDEVTLTPLSAWGTDYVPPSNVPIDSTRNMDEPINQVMAMDAVTYFNNLCQIMADNPPYAADAEAMKKFAMIGIVPGADYSKYYLKLDSATQAEIVNGYKAGIARLSVNSGVVTNGWWLYYGTGDYGTDYDFRASSNYKAMAPNLTEDALYPSTFSMTDGQRYSSTNKYVLHFDRDKIPPVNGFWSLTMYNDKQLLAQNSIGRYKVGSLSDPNLVMNSDGSLDIYIQRDSPGTDKYNNWLPTPESGNFTMMMRLYWPEDTAVNGSWVPPEVKLVQ